MSHLIKDRQLVTDEWSTLAEDVALPATGKIIMSWDRRQTLPAAIASSLSIGVKIPNTLDVQSHWGTLRSCPLIALEFPAFPDGRAYSQARLLRDMGYSGEIRATGAAVVRDQLLGMARCGISSFQLRADQSPDSALAAFADFSCHYQPATDHSHTVLGLRSSAQR